MISERVLTKLEFAGLVLDFNEAVKLNKYNRIPYSIYSYIKRGPGEKALVKRVMNHMYITFQDSENPEDMRKVYESETNDGSLGEFLFDTLFLRKDINMKYNNNLEKIDNAKIAELTKIENNNYDSKLTWAGDPWTYDGLADSATSTGIYSTTTTDVLTPDVVDALKVDKATVQSTPWQSPLSGVATGEDIRKFQSQMDEMGEDIRSVDERIGRLTAIADDLMLNTGLLDKVANFGEQLISLAEINKVNKNMSVIGAPERKENEMNTNKMFNFEFGPVDANVRMSPYGMAIRNAEGKYVSYDAKTGSVMDVEILNFEGHKFMYKMPVAIKDIAVGDVVIHNRKPMFVVNVGDKVTVVDIYNGEEKNILPSKSMFGFDFVTEVVSLINFGDANAENPFGSMWPFLVMGEGTDMKDAFMMMALANGGPNAMMNNPMLMAMMLSGDKDMEKMLPLMMMGQFMAPANHVCGCQGHGHTTEG